MHMKARKSPSASHQTPPPKRFRPATTIKDFLCVINWPASSMSASMAYGITFGTRAPKRSRIAWTVWSTRRAMASTRIVRGEGYLNSGFFRRRPRPFLRVASPQTWILRRGRGTITLLTVRMKKPRRKTSFWRKTNFWGETIIWRKTIIQRETSIWEETTILRTTTIWEKKRLILSRRVSILIVIAVRVGHL